ncbi:polysaccharide deacetylase family protein [Rhodococcus wratislaviensis]|uniref:polysaccharide deacetylase family protein n=1 Tax=Rhodococcus wratislaviensis TaxID=44752 RepID=UPI003656CFE7
MPELTLTFDNGPTPGVTEHVLDVLEERNLKATFFVIGRKLQTAEGGSLVERARVQGHWIGNHTMTHGEPLGTLNDPERELAEITGAQKLLGPLGEPHRLFRPTGHGSIGPHLLTPITADYLIANAFTVALWTLFVRDTKFPAGWVDRALELLPERDHHVLVVHDLPTGAMDDLPRFLDTAAARGVTFVQDFPDDCTPVKEGTPSPSFRKDYVTNPSTSTVTGAK